MDILKLFLGCPVSKIMSTNICEWLTTEQHQVATLGKYFYTSIIK